jgi:glycosyltransferase involved in cell wall biosynthesis
LPVGVLLKAFKKTKLIYDTHELETERAGLTGFKQKLSKLLEKSLFGYIDSTIVVSNSINKWYRDAYRNDKIYSVRNIPDLRGKNGFTKQSLLKERFCIRNDELLYIYQGLLSRGRGIEILLEVFSDSQITAHVVFMGYGNYEAKIREYSGKHKNIHFIEAVPPDEIIKYSSSADIGICLIENIGLSYYYCLPNKVFEYTLAGIPVIVSNFPDLSEYIQNINGGWKINPNTNELKELISTLSYVDVNNMKLKLLGIEKKIGWEFEEEELKKAYL